MPNLDRPPENEGPEDFLSVSLGHFHLANCHFGCLKDALCALDEILGVDQALFTTWSLKTETKWGTKLNYTKQELTCLVKHEEKEETGEFGGVTFS